MGVSEWQQMDRCEKEALLEFRRDAEEEAAQVEGLPEADSELALEFMRKEHRAEQLSADRGDCVFEAICDTEKDGQFGAAGLREEVVQNLLEKGEITAQYAEEMSKQGTWATDKELMEAANIVRRRITVVVMRPRMGEEVLQYFEPEFHDGDIMVVARPGHMNATRRSEWRLNERSRRMVRRVLNAVAAANASAVMQHRISTWRQQMAEDVRPMQMTYKRWEVSLKPWCGGVTVSDFWPEAGVEEQLEQEQLADGERRRAAEEIRDPDAEKKDAAQDLRAALEAAEPGEVDLVSDFGGEYFRSDWNAAAEGTVEDTTVQRAYKNMSWRRWCKRWWSRGGLEQTARLKWREEAISSSRVEGGAGEC